MSSDLSKKVLITGCSGFLAAHLMDALLKEKHPIISGITEVPNYQSPRMTVYHVDLSQRDKVFDAIKTIRPDMVFHLAAIANVGFSWAHQELTYQVNFIGTSNLLEALYEFSPTCRILLMSSAELYGNAKLTPYNESDPIAPPMNPYALSKLAMEMLGDLYAKAMKMDIIKIRAFNFTGPAQDRKFMASDFSSQIAEIEKGLREPVIRTGNLSAVRDISDVRDIARYLTVIANKGQSCSVYNLCSGFSYAIQQILDMLLSFSTQKIAITVDSDKIRPSDVPVLSGDNTLIQRTFQLEPEYQIQQTLLDLLNYWREQLGHH